MITAGHAAAAMVCTAAIALGAQAPSAPPQAARPGSRFVAIGCISRPGPSTAANRGSTGVADGAARPGRFILTEMRGAPPAVYRLEGDASLLALHVGHTVEITGPLMRVDGGAASAPWVFTVNALTDIATACLTAPD